MSSIISLMTDFGVQDGFVGTMKGVILGINPDVSIVDLTHDITPQDVDEAAFLLRNAYPYFPSGTIHVVVVDPGVGTERPAIIVETSNALFVGPDNGVFAYIYRMESRIRVTHITNRDYCLSDLSHTFHGRDVFAPVAAHLSCGVKASDCGAEIHDYVRGEIPEPMVSQNHIQGHVVHIDRFGNVITDIPEKEFLDMTHGRTFLLTIADTRIDRLSVSYADVPNGDPLAIIGSAGLLEIAINGDDAAQTLGITRGRPVMVAVEETGK